MGFTKNAINIHKLCPIEVYYIGYTPNGFSMTPSDAGYSWDCLRMLVRWYSPNIFRFPTFQNLCWGCYVFDLASPYFIHVWVVMLLRFESVKHAVCKYVPSLSCYISYQRYCISHKSLAGWWFGTMEFYDFPFSWECHHPIWRTPSFFRGVGEKPPTRLLLTIINHIIIYYQPLTIY